MIAVSQRRGSAREIVSMSVVGTSRTWPDDSSMSAFDREADLFPAQADVGE